MPKGRKRRTYYFSVKPVGFSGGNFSLHLAGTFSTSIPFKYKAKRDIPCGICGEESAIAISFLRLFFNCTNQYHPNMPHTYSSITNAI